MTPFSSSQFSLQMKTTSYKSQDLIYEEPGYRLVVYVEMCFAKGFDWTCGYGDFENWTFPEGEPISPEKQEEIIRRVEDWSRKEGEPVLISPIPPKEEVIAFYQSHGFEILHISEDSYVAYPSNCVPPIIIKEEEVADYEKSGWFVQAAPGLAGSFVAFAPEPTSPQKQTDGSKYIRYGFNRKS